MYSYNTKIKNNHHHGHSLLNVTEKTYHVHSKTSVIKVHQGSHDSILFSAEMTTYMNLSSLQYQKRAETQDVYLHTRSSLIIKTYSAFQEIPAMSPQLHLHHNYYGSYFCQLVSSNSAFSFQYVSSMILIPLPKEK
jgi:hypothetical protein